jgi:hypothetical protein
VIRDLCILMLTLIALIIACIVVLRLTNPA